MQESGSRAEQSRAEQSIAIHYGKNLIVPSVNQNGAIAGSVCLGLWKRDFLLNNALFFNESIRMEEDVSFNFSSEYHDRMFVKADLFCYIYRVNPCSASHEKCTVKSTMRNYESSKTSLLLFKSFLDRDKSEKLKNRIRLQSEKMIVNLLRVCDRKYVKKELSELKKEKLFPISSVEGEKTNFIHILENWIRKIIFTNIRSSFHFWFSYYCNKMIYLIKR